MALKCENILTYKKVDAEEIIDVGDIIMIDPDSGYITKAVIGSPEEMPINTRLVIGVCIKSNNYAKINIVIDGGPAKDIERIDASSVAESIDIILLDGGTGEQNQREIIEVAYTGEWPVNVCGFIDIGDKLRISEHAGKAKAIDYIDNDFFKSRSIGKVVKYMKNKEQVKVLLDIE